VLRIAVATTDGRAVDEHFGRSVRFDVYDLDADRSELIETRSLTSLPEHDDRAPSRLEAVRDCAIVHVTAIGPSAAAQVVNAGVMPLKIAEGTPVTDVVGRLQAVLGGTPPPWLRKLLRAGASDDAPGRRWSPS
jgi:nitrogen fixation protein NifX